MVKTTGVLSLLLTLVNWVTRSGSWIGRHSLTPSKVRVLPITSICWFSNAKRNWFECAVGSNRTSYSYIPLSFPTSSRTKLVNAWMALPDNLHLCKISNMFLLIHLMQQIIKIKWDKQHRLWKNWKFIPHVPVLASTTTSWTSSSNGAASASISCRVGAFFSLECWLDSSRRFNRNWANASDVDAISNDGFSIGIAGGADTCSWAANNNRPRPTGTAGGADTAAGSFCDCQLIGIFVQN